jgi:phosphoribosyl 1,2-cyclic phosphate phosphodiesterase
MSSRFVFLGSGAAQGLPYPGCWCEGCVEARRNPKLRRARSAAAVETPGGSLVLDLGLGIKERLHANDMAVDALAVTHMHFDHTFDLWQWRLMAPGVPAVMPIDGLGRQVLAFICGTEILPAEPFSKLAPLESIHLTPLPLNHTCRTMGYRIDGPDFCVAYLTDTYGLPGITRDFLAEGPDLDLLVVDATYPQSTAGTYKHNDVNMALEVIRDLRPSRSVLTHLGHRHASQAQLEHQVRRAARRVDAGDVIVAQDGLSLDLP